MSLTVTVSPFSSPQIIGYYVACTAYDPIIPVVCVLTVDSLELIIFPFHHKETRVPLINAVQISFPAIDKESPTFPSAMCLLVSLFYGKRVELTIPFDGDRPLEKIHLRSCLLVDEKQMIQHYQREAKEHTREMKEQKQETEKYKQEAEEHTREMKEQKQETEKYKREAEKTSSKLAAALQRIAELEGTPKKRKRPKGL